jgi:hypothetical protein
MHQGHLNKQNYKNMVKYAYPDINKSTLENSFENDIYKT